MTGENSAITSDLGSQWQLRKREVAASTCSRSCLGVPDRTGLLRSVGRWGQLRAGASRPLLQGKFRRAQVHANSGRAYGLAPSSFGSASGQCSWCRPPAPSISHEPALEVEAIAFATSHPGQ